MAAIELNSTPLISESTLKAYYRFSSGALTTDSSGESHTLTAISDPAEDASGKFAGAVALDGDDGYSAVAHADLAPTTAFSVGAWVKVGDLEAAGIVISNYYFDDPLTTRYGFYLAVNDAEKIRFNVAKGTGTVENTDYINFVGNTALTTSQWQHIVGVWDGTNVTVYLNGVADGTAAWANAPVYFSTKYPRIGCHYAETGNTSFFTGSIDDAFLFNGKALTATEVSNLYNGTWSTGNFLAFL